MPPERLADDVSIPGAPFVTAIRRHAEQDPDGIAVTDADGSIPGGELDAGANRLARAHQERGVTAGSFVTIGLPNSIAFVEAIAGRRSGTS